MTVDDVIQAFECLGSDEDEDLPTDRAMAILADLMVSQAMGPEALMALLDVGATLWRLGLAERMREV